MKCRAAVPLAFHKVLDKCRRISNVAEYEGSLDVDARIVTDRVAADERAAVKRIEPGK